MTGNYGLFVNNNIDDRLRSPMSNVCVVDLIIVHDLTNGGSTAAAAGS